MQHVIIGAGPAGVVAAETLRKLSPEAEITIIGEEPEAPYSRMALPYYLVDHIGEAGTHLRKRAGWYESQRIEVIRERVSGVDPSAKRLTTDGGGSRSYDRLLVATGSTPLKPPIDGMDLPGVHNCWTLADARAIIDRARPGSRVVLMGAGFIGCIILEALASREVKLTVIEMEDRMVPRMMNQRSGGLIKTWCESKGVEVLTSTRVEGVAAVGSGPKKRGFFARLMGRTADAGAPSRVLDVTLSGGRTLQADLVICATGVKPNTGFLSGSGVEIDGGVVVDNRLQSSVADVYAAGDVARGKDFSTGGYSVQAIQPTAVEHGRIAATNMSEGHAIEHRGSVNMNVLDTMGLVSASFGEWQGVDGGDSTELFDAERYRYIDLQFREDVLVGANSLGLTQHVGVLRGLIQTRLALGAWKERLVRDPTRIMEAYLDVAQG